MQTALTDGPLVESLKRGREGFNARFAYARRLNRQLDPDVLAWHLAQVLDPVVRPLADSDPDRVDGVVRTLFDLSLDLIGRDCLGPASRYPAVGDAWTALLPAAPKFLLEEPRKLAAAVTNAAFNLSRESDAAAREWISRLRALLPLCPDLETFLAAGQVAAWRCGLAHFRDGAVEVWRTLPDGPAMAVLGLDNPRDRPDRAAVEAALADPWRFPETAGLNLKYNLEIVAQVGGFRGFGGPFLSPPEVILADGAIYAFDRSQCFSLHADCFGAVFKRFGPDLPPGVGGRAGFGLDQDGTVTKGQVNRRFSELAGFSSFAASDHTLAVTSEQSHRVRLVALTPEKPK